MGKDKKGLSLTKTVIKAITEAAIGVYNSEKKADAQKYHDRRYQNTKLLLQNYHKFKAYRNNAIYEASQVEDNIIIAEIMQESPEGNFSVDSIKKNVAITHTMLAHIDEMLEVYKRRCLRSSKPEVKRRWRVLEAMHLMADEEGNVDDIAEKENVSSRLIQYDLKKIYEELSELFFGIDFNDMLQ